MWKSVSKELYEKADALVKKNHCISSYVNVMDSRFFRHPLWLYRDKLSLNDNKSIVPFDIALFSKVAGTLIQCVFQRDMSREVFVLNLLFRVRNWRL